MIEYQIADDIKQSRLETLYLVQDEIMEELNKKHVGSITEALIIDYDMSSYAYIGRNYAFAPDDIDGFIYIYSAKELKIGDVVKIRILDSAINTLEAELV